MYNAKFDRYCLNDIELLPHRRRDAINTMELFVFRGSRTPLLCRPPPPLPRPSLALFVPRQIRYRVIFQRDYINCPGDTGAPLITGAIAVMSLGRLFSRERARCFYFQRLTRLRSVAVSSSGPVTIVSRLSFPLSLSGPSPPLLLFSSLYFINAVSSIRRDPIKKKKAEDHHG